MVVTSPPFQCPFILPALFWCSIFNFPLSVETVLGGKEKAEWKEDVRNNTWYGNRGNCVKGPTQGSTRPAL